MTNVDFWQAVLRAGYGASMGKIDREYRKIDEKRHSYQIQREKKRYLQKYLHKLKKQGLISENSLNQITLSKKGKHKLNSLRDKKILNKNSYKEQPGEKVIIISYDLPTPFNKERDILREILKMLGFNMIHKSVWVGKVKIPKEFIFAVERLGILKFVEILEVTKNGSLHQFSK